MGLDGVDATPDIHHDVDMVLDEFHRAHHLADALAGQILEVAGLENRDHAFLDLLAELDLLVVRGHLGEGGGGLVDGFSSLENVLRRLLGAADDRAELARDPRHFLAIEALAVQDRDLLLGLVDGVVNQIEFDLELFALFDLRAR